MKKLNKKGFTIVELVIVIAVIAILSAVLIPTFTNVTEKAKDSAALQTARSTYTTILTQENGQLDDAYTYYIKIDNGSYWYKVENGKVVEAEALEEVKNVSNTGDTPTEYSEEISVDDYAFVSAATVDVDGDIVTDHKIIVGDLSANVVVYKVANA